MNDMTPPTAQKEPVKILTLAEQEAVVKEEIQRFIKLSKEKPTLTIEEINEALPPELVAPQALDMFMHGLEANGVVITELVENKDAEGEGAFLADPDKDDEEVDEEEAKE